MADLQFLKSAAGPKDYPGGDQPEVAITGRSNAGKSSFLNQLGLNQRRPIVKISQKPGKTRLLNFFALGKYRWVDMPGYGFATRGGDEMQSWQALIETYLSSRPNLVGAVLIMDIRRPWTVDEENLRAFFNAIALPFCVVLSKADKVAGGQIRKHLDEIMKASGAPVFAVSNTRREGADAVENFCFREWVKPALEGKTTADQGGTH